MSGDLMQDLLSCYPKAKNSKVECPSDTWGHLLYLDIRRTVPKVNSALYTHLQLYMNKLFKHAHFHQHMVTYLWAYASACFEYVRRECLTSLQQSLHNFRQILFQLQVMHVDCWLITKVDTPLSAGTHHHLMACLIKLDLMKKDLVHVFQTWS